MSGQPFGAQDTSGGFATCAGTVGEKISGRMDKIEFHRRLVVQWTKSMLDQRKLRHAPAQGAGSVFLRQAAVGD